MALRLAGIPLSKKIGEGSSPQWKSSADPVFVPLASDLGFRIATADSAHRQESVTLGRNHRSRCAGITGHVRSEIAVTILRNRRSRSTGIIGHVGPEYAPDSLATLSRSWEIEIDSCFRIHCIT
jgi:hypothetical protein